MSYPGHESQASDLSEAIRRDFASIMSLSTQIAEIASDRQGIIDSIRQRIIGGHVPEEQRFIARELMNPALTKLNPREVFSRVAFWEQLDEQVRTHAGETVAWLEPEEEIVSHRLPGPDNTRFNYYLNLGILLPDARLQNESSYDYKIPIEKAVRIRFFYNLDEELAWDMGIGDLHHFVGEPELLADPEVVLTKDRMLPLKAWGFPNSVNIPIPIIGNEAVAAVLDRNSLADQPEVLQAAQMLTESLAA